jgi:hypothetical protein
VPQRERERERERVFGPHSLLNAPVEVDSLEQSSSAPTNDRDLEKKERQHKLSMKTLTKEETKYLINNE